MKNLIITAILTSVSGLSAFAQTQQAPSFILNQHLTGNQHYKASQFIEMGFNQGSTTGFEYNSVYSNGEFVAEIDPFMVFPPVEGEEGGPEGYENIVGDDGVVGATKGNLSVNEAGSAVYQIPLEFPGGISGMTPELSLVYNNSGSDGILGPGWSLGGLSVISCVPATRYHNGIRQAAYGNDLEDGAYTLDGQRLVPVFYKDDINFREYRTEMNVFSKIMRKANTSGGKDEAGKYFEVITKSGLTYIYGQNEDSRHSFYHVGTSKKYTISYYVNSIIDNMGNKITFEYNNDQDNGEITIKSIKYTFTDCSAGSAPIYSIDFGYKTRPNLLIYHLDYKTSTDDITVKTSTSNIIEKISCTHVETNTIVKEYILDYILRGPGSDDNKKNLYLYAVQEFGKNGDEEYNKTVFEWEEELQEYSFNETEIQLPETSYYSWTVYGNHQGDVVKNVKYLFIDVNLDGKTDILRTYQLQRKDLVNSAVVFTYFYVIEYLMKDSEGDYIKSEVYKHEDTSFSWTNFETYIIPGDFDGDAFIDLMICSFNESKSLFYLVKNNGNNFGNNNILNIESISGFNNYYIPFLGDFNGDGISDLWFVPSSGSGNQIWRLGNKLDPLENNLDVRGDESLTYNAQIPNVTASNVRIVDFNGDGRSDIRFGNDKVYYLKPVSGQNTIQASSESVQFSNTKEAIMNIPGKLGQ